MRRNAGGAVAEPHSICRCRASYQQSRDSSSSEGDSDVKGLERTKELTGRGKDFQQWSKKTEAFFVGVIMESELLETALMVFTSYEANDIVAKSRKNPLEAWRKLQKRYDPTTGGRKRHLLRTVFSSGISSGYRTLGVLRSHYEKQPKDKLDDEIKLAGFE